MEKFKKIMPTILMILFELAVGVLLLIDAEAFTTVVFTVFGIILIVLGIVMLIRYLHDRKSDEASPLTLATAIFELIIGAVFAFGSSLIIGVIALTTLIYGIIMVISGIFKLSDYITLRTAHIPVSGFALLSAIVSVALGIVIVFNPFGTTIALWTCMGIVLIVQAVIDVISIMMAHRIAKALNVEAKEIS